MTHVGEADNCMLLQAEKRFCGTLPDIRVLGTGHSKAIYNAMLSEYNPMSFISRDWKTQKRT